MTTNNDSIDHQFRYAMRRMATTVCIISSANQDKQHAMTATSITSLSMEPPSLLICVNKQTALHDLLINKANFCVNILNSQQEALSVMCSRIEEGKRRFENDCWAQDESGIPWIKDAQANIFCTNETSFSYASHTAFIGQVTKTICENTVDPLIYLNGEYTKSTQFDNN